MRFVLINESQKAPLAPEVTTAWLEHVAEAITIQLNRDVAASWGGQYDVRVSSGPTDIGPSEIPFGLLDSIPDPGAVAAHDVVGSAQPYAVLGLDACHTLDDVSIAISHELCEIAADPACNTWRDDGQGREWPQEACDAVEASSYRIKGTSVSDFVLPAFFEQGAPGPYCYTQAIGSTVLGTTPIAPFETASGGYQVVRNVGTGQTEVHGEIPAARLAKARTSSSRVYRRGARV